MYSQFSNRLLGLFANAIVNGGNALCDMFHQSNPQEAAVELASRLDCTSEKGEDILRCLSTQTQQEIVLKQSAMFVSPINFVFCNNVDWMFYISLILRGYFTLWLHFLLAILLIPKMVLSNCRWSSTSRYSRKSFNSRKVRKGSLDDRTNQGCWSILLPLDHEHIQWW